MDVDENIVLFVVCGHDINIPIGTADIEILHATGSYSKGAEDDQAASKKTLGSLYNHELVKTRIDCILKHLKEFTHNYQQVHILTTGTKPTYTAEFAHAEILMRELVRELKPDFFIKTGHRMKAMTRVRNLEDTLPMVQKYMTKFGVNQVSILLPSNEQSKAQSLFPNEFRLIFSEEEMQLRNKSTHASARNSPNPYEEDSIMGDSNSDLNFISQTPSQKRGRKRKREHTESQQDTVNKVYFSRK